jgi:PST family polysaccharide transporter
LRYAIPAVGTAIDPALLLQHWCRMTAQTTQNLDRTLVHGIAWTGAIRWATQMLSWAATFILARLLTPTDYGLVGMAMIYIGLAQIVSEGGVAAAVVQQRDLTEQQIAELNGLAAMIGVVLFVVTLVLAGPIAWFFSEPQVYSVVLALSSVFLIRGVQVVPRAMLARDLNFRLLAWVDGLETFSLMIVTMGLALMQFGYWALALGGIASSVLTTILSLKWRPHRLVFPKFVHPIRRSVDFAWQVVTSQVAWYAYSNADFAVAGRVLGKAALGAYSFAWTIASVPVDRVTGMVARVTPAFFAAVQHDPPALRRYLLNLTEGLALVTLPACIGLAVVAPEFVSIVLGPAWSAAIVPLRLLSICAAFRSIITPAPQILIATGRSKQSMYFSLLAALILPPAFYYGARWGTAGVAMGWLIVYPVIAIGFFMRYAFRIIGMSWREYLRAIAPAAGASAVMAFCVIAVRALTPQAWPPLEKLLGQVFVGAAVYCAITFTANGERLRAVHSLLRPAGKGKGIPELIYDSGPTAANDRLLLISYHFAPGTAIGALRWRKLARYAVERGWGLDVITLDPAALTSHDAAALAELPPGIRIYGVSPTTPPIERTISETWHVVRRIPGLLKGSVETVIPTNGAVAPRVESRACTDARWLPREPRDLIRAYYSTMERARFQRWSRDAARLALQVYDSNSHRAVITCGPPHEAHEAGAAIARRTRLPLITDFRDPWSMVQRLPEQIASRVGLALAARAESRVIRQSALVVANTLPLRNALRQAYPEAAGRVIAVPNGFDDDPVPASRPNRRFTVAYAGTVYLDRDPRGFFQGAARVIQELELTPADFGIAFMGLYQAYDGVPLETIAQDAGIGDFVTVHPARSRTEALNFLADASMLVVLPQDSDMAIPAKVFDYARFDAWVLVFAERGSATQLLLQGTAADVARPGDVDALTEILRKRYLQHVRGEQAVRLSTEEQLSRRHQAGILFDAIEGIIGAPRRPETVVAPAQQPMAAAWPATRMLKQA